MPIDDTVAKLVRRAKQKLDERFKRRPELAPPYPGDLAGKVAFAVGSGRCGTHFVAKLLEEEPDVFSVHERDPMLEQFHRYCSWYELPIDDAGFLHVVEQRIRQDLGGGKQLSFESSPTLCLSMPTLEPAFLPRWLHLIRNPRDVVTSYLHKGWYTQPFVQKRPELALGYQAGTKFQHFFGRIAPRTPSTDPSGIEFAEWNRLTRVGKLAWYWAAVNAYTLSRSTAIPAARFRTLRLEDFDYGVYRDVATYLGFAPRLSRERFDEIRTARPGKQKNIPKQAWSAVEEAELARFAGELANRFEYSLAPRK